MHRQGVAPAAGSRAAPRVRRLIRRRRRPAESIVSILAVGFLGEQTANPHLSSELFRTSEVLAVYDPAGKSLIILSQPRNLREPRDVVVASCHHQRIKPFSPPIILSGPFLTQRQYPFIPLLDGLLDRGSELQELVGPILDENVLDPAPDRLSMTEGGARAVLPKRSLRQLIREWLLRVAHDLGDDIAMQMLMLGRV